MTNSIFDSFMSVTNEEKDIPSSQVGRLRVQSGLSLGKVTFPQTSSPGLKGSPLHHPIGLTQFAQELFLLLFRQEARLCRIDVL